MSICILELLNIYTHAYIIDIFFPNAEAVALHEAAEYGSIECVKELLALGAPSCPRNVRMETPTDLAKRNGHFEIVRLLGKNANH